MNTNNKFDSKLTLVTAATGKTGKRVVQHLVAAGKLVRAVSRQSAIPFDWNDESTWEAALTGVHAVYLVYTPDLAVPGADLAVKAFTDLAKQLGVKKIVLLSGRGEEAARRGEIVVENAGMDWTIVRAGWFDQNFSEGEFYEMIMAGHVYLPAGDMPEPFIDIDDIADVAFAALTEAGHEGKIYEVTGPQAITLKQAVQKIANATGQAIEFHDVTIEEVASGMAADGADQGFIELLSYLFTLLEDGRNAEPQNGIQQALNREPSSFDNYVEKAIANNAWKKEVQA